VSTRNRALSSWACLAVAASALGCGGSPRTGTREPAAGRLTELRLDDRPSLRLVARAGDPWSAVSYVLPHGLGAAALQPQFTQGLKKRGWPGLRVSALPYELRVEVLIAGPEQAARFVQELDGLLTSEAGDPRRSRSGLGTVALDAAELDKLCSSGVSMSLSSESSGGSLGDWQGTFAAVGAPQVLRAVEQAVEALPPRTLGPVAHFTLADAVGHSAAAPLPSGLTLLWLSPDAALVHAFASESRLGEATLQGRLGSAEAGWKLREVGARTLPGGACLRLELSAEGSVDAAALASALLSSEDEVRAFGERAQLLPALRRAALHRDPRDAASAAALDLLTARTPPIDRAWGVLLPAAISAQQFSSSVERLRSTKSSFELRVATEAGQDAVWLLAGSACSARPRSSTQASASTLWLDTVASTDPRPEDVRLQAWLSAEGEGLIGHATPLPFESSEALGRRVARAVARALTASRPTASVIAEQRAERWRRLSRQEQAGLLSWLDQSSPGAARWLEPLGSQLSLAHLPLDLVRSSPALLTRERLRVAVLGNAGGAQRAAIEQALRSWLMPFRPELDCAGPAAARSWQFGEHVVQTQATSPSVYLLVPLAAATRGLDAIGMLHLDRWLTRGEAAARPERPRARLHASPEGSLLLVELAANDDPAEAARLLRGAVERALLNPPSQADLESYRSRVDALSRTRRLDPRVRLIELWKGAQPRSTADTAALQAWLAQLRPERQIVVVPRRTGP
jgi:hypothetical protein